MLEMDSMILFYPPVACEVGIITHFVVEEAEVQGCLVILHGHSAVPSRVLVSLGHVSTRMPGCGGGDV